MKERGRVGVTTVPVVGFLQKEYIFEHVAGCGFMKRKVCVVERGKICFSARNTKEVGGKGVKVNNLRTREFTTVAIYIFIYTW